MKHVPAFRVGLVFLPSLAAMLGSSECFLSFSALYLSGRMEEGKGKRTFFTVLRVTILVPCQGQQTP